MRFSAVILAGGKSSRMGRDKAWLETGGQTLLARQIALASGLGAEEIFISGREGADYSAFSHQMLKDNFKNAGPLAGIESALGVMATPLLLVLAVDLAKMQPEFLRSLFARCKNRRGAIPRVSSQIEPLAAFYPSAAKLFAGTLLRDKNNSVRIFAKCCVQMKLACFIEYGTDEQGFFANWNSPADIRD